MHYSRYNKIMLLLVVLMLFASTTNAQVYNSVSFQLIIPDTNSSFSIVDVQGHFFLFPKNDSILHFDSFGQPETIVSNNHINISFTIIPPGRQIKNGNVKLIIPRIILQILYVQNGELNEMTLITQYKNINSLKSKGSMSPLFKAQNIFLKPGVYNAIINFSKKKKDKLFRTTPQLIKQE